jgi:exodeoxyribonuclease V alpha subunit
MLILSTRSAATPPANPAETEINGRLGSISKIFDNGDTQTIIAKLSDGRTIRGTVDDPGELQAGGYYLFVGHWNEHPKYGWQFAFSEFATDVPRDVDGAAAYLARHCEGIGATTANRLVEKYGGDAVRVLTLEPQRVVDDGILRPAIAQAAAQSLREVCDPSLAEAHLELFRLLRSGGGGFSYGKLIAKCLKLWGKAAPERIRRDPFTLLVRELPGCGFLRCDRLYTSLGHPPDRLKRQMLAVWYELRQRGDDTWVSLDKAFQAVRNRIGGTTARPERAVALGYRAGWLDHRMDEHGGHWIAERGKARAERTVAQRVRLLREAGPPAWPKGPFAGLSEHQQRQIDIALQGMIAVLTGSPGTGKTFTAAAIIRAIADARGLGGVAVCAPTGKAAVRISEVMRRAGLAVDGTTIHKLLGVRGGGDGGDWKFAFHENTPLPYRFIIVDEISMLDVDLAASLLRACAPGTHLLLVGDVHQLPPVGHGAPLRDLLDAGVPAARLTEIRRNAGSIVESCAAIKDGKPFTPIYRLSDWDAQKNLVHLPARDAEAMRDTILGVYDWLASQHLWDIVDQVQVLECVCELTSALL